MEQENSIIRDKSYKCTEDDRVALYIDYLTTPSELPPIADFWIILRSYEEFKQWFNDNHFIPELISFNFCLSEEYLRYVMLNPVGTPIVYETLGSGSGASCAVFLSHLLLKNNLKAKRICIHGNRDDRGCREMQKFINSWKEEQDCFMTTFEIEDMEEVIKKDPIAKANYEVFLKIQEEVEDKIKRENAFSPKSDMVDSLKQEQK